MAEIQLTEQEQQVIAELETQLGRPLTTHERSSVEVFMAYRRIARDAAQNQFADEDLGTFIATAHQILDRATFGALTPGQTFDFPDVPSVDELVGVVGGLPVEGLPTSALTGLTDVSRASFGVSDVSTPATQEGAPAEFNFTGEVDAFGRPIIEGTLEGQAVVWDAESGQIMPAIVLDDDDDGPLPIGAQFFGIESPEDQLPTNIGEVQAEFTNALDSFRTQSRAEADALGLGPSYQAPGPAPVVGEVQFGRPEYYPGDQWIDFATKSPEYQTQVQRAMVEAGLMRESDVAEGIWTIDAAQGMESAMLMANSTGGAKSWVDVVSDLAGGLAAAGNAPGGGGGSGVRRQLVVPAYIEPDYAALETQVKDAFRGQLQRDPADWEIALLADNLNANYRKEYDSQVAALRSEFAAGNSGAAISQAGTVQGVDPIARLRSQIEDKYTAEIEFGEDRGQRRNDLTTVGSILTQTQNVLSGGAA